MKIPFRNSVHTFKFIIISYKLMYTAVRKNLNDPLVLETYTVKEEEQHTR